MAKTDKQASGGPPAKNVRQNSIGWMLKTLASRLDRNMNEALEPLGLSLGQFSILMTLLECDDMTQSQIGKKISMPGYATTRNLDGLEQSGIVERHDDEHSRRTNRIRLTAKGKTVGAKLFPIVRQVNEDLLSGLNKADQEVLKKLLQSLTLS